MTYEYECNSCNYQWEAQQKITEKPIETCPNCGAKTAKRLISKSSSFILKGDNWASKKGY